LANRGQTSQFQTATTMRKADQRRESSMRASISPLLRTGRTGIPGTGTNRPNTGQTPPRACAQLQPAVVTVIRDAC
jgi:hypothetical protein